MQLASPASAVAQAAIVTAPEETAVVLDDTLDPWVSSAYRAAGLCYATMVQLINEHAVFTDANRLANAQKLKDALEAEIARVRTEMFAKGLTFEQSQVIDSYFYQLTQPKTARYVETKQAGALAIDLRTCPAAVQRLQQQ
jgi:hypothetical protein